MRAFSFYQLDVFTDTPLDGNPLAVFPHADGLDARTMQRLAREMNLSETTFVTPSPSATRRVRFFTPAAEIPLAGHPTVGTWWLLAELGELGALPADDTTIEVTQETGVGVLPVHVQSRDGAPYRTVMAQPRPTFGPICEDRAELASALGGDEQVLASGPTPQVVETAMPQLMIPIASVDHLASLPEGGTGGRLAALLRTLGTDCAMCFVPPEDGATVRCRMFAPGLGVPEDPATGSAAGALGCYLVRHAIVSPTSRSATIEIHQGIEIGRPSRIHVEIGVDTRGDVDAVRVGGRAVTIITGEVRL